MSAQRRSLLLALAALAAFGCGGASSDDAPVAVSSGPPSEAGTERAGVPDEVPLERVGEAALRARIAASGTIEARRLTEVGAEVAGRVEAVFVDVGDAVATGAPLFRIDPGPYRLAVAEARAALELARAESANADAEAARLARLVAQAVASQQRHEQLQTLAEVARARVAAAEARLARARRDLSLTEVRAPYAASVVERRADEGSMAGAGAILVIQESGALEAILNVPEASPLAVRVGDPARIWVEGAADPVATAVTRVSDRVDPQTRTYEVRAEIPASAGRVKAGSYARAELEPTRAEARPVVPRSAVLNRDGRAYVLRVVAGRVVHTPARVGVLTDDRAELLAGASAGEWVVTGDAVRRLENGTPIEIVDDAGAIATAATVSAARESGT